MRCLLYLVPLLPLAPLARAQCALVSVSGCQPDPAEVILTLPLPSGQGAATCQQLCRDQEPCRYWSLTPSAPAPPCAGVLLTINR